MRAAAYSLRKNEITFFGLFFLVWWLIIMVVVGVMRIKTVAAID